MRRGGGDGVGGTRDDGRGVDHSIHRSVAETGWGVRGPRGRLRRRGGKAVPAPARTETDLKVFILFLFFFFKDFFIYS